MATTPSNGDNAQEAPPKSPFDELFARKTTIPSIDKDSSPAPDTGVYIGYARVSRADQVLDRQTDRLKEAGCTTIFTDKYTGASLRRPQFQKMCYSLEPGDTVMVTQLDRLGRNMQDTLRVLSAFDELRVRFVVLNMGLDTATSQGRFVMGLFASLAELEREWIRERTIAGLESARKRGNFGGRAKVIDNKKAADIMKWRFDYDMEVAAVAAKARVGERTVYKFLRERAESDAAGVDDFYVKYGLDNYSPAMPDKGDGPEGS
ncbi:MAG: hypothetical protein DI630_13305 [Gordonia sp. (in: high G+C Gram-positive bacteria)]|nr:MAG: hypothetical protein DI630_13305 [Gordonia sp. (in: high G+C Gram-positive bacteria)]